MPAAPHVRIDPDQREDQARGKDRLPRPGHQQRQRKQPRDPWAHQHRHSAVVQPTVPLGAPPHRHCRDGQRREGEDDRRIERQELQRLEDERHTPCPDQHDGHVTAHEHHRDDPEGGDPAEPAVKIEAAGRDEDVLHQVDRHPAHEEEGVDVNPDRRREGRPARQILVRKPADDDNRHQHRGAKEEALVPSGRRDGSLS